MEFKTKFNIGDSVYHIKYTQTTKFPCTVCDETGTVIIKSNNYLCPKCHGKKYTYIDDMYHWGIAEINPVEIEAIYIEHDKTYKEPMIEYEGRGLGELCREEYLFGSIKEAQAECNRLNGDIENAPTG